ncbi:MAG: oxidoreductase protein [Rhizobium sp.]|nr:oxidoreductase protein [Rhizobium sp.]
MESTPDIVIIGSGMGGATLAYALAPSGASILILEAGDHIPDQPENRDQHAIFARGHFRPKEQWYEPDGRSYNPGNYYNVGGNSKFYGAVLLRYRREDFAELKHREGVSPAWPFAYEELEPWYGAAERLFQVRGKNGEDPTEPAHSTDYPYPPVPDEPPVALIRERLGRLGVHPFSLPLGVDIEAWLKGGKTPWDAHPHSFGGKMDAETCALALALEHPNVRLQTRSRVLHLEAAPDGNRITTVHYEKDGASHRISPRLIVLSAGAVQSAALLLRSADARNPHGLANVSDQVGRNYMNHNTTAVIGLSPFFRNDAIHQKTFGFNDFYLTDGEGGAPLGNVQLLGRVSGTILKANVPSLPKWLLDKVSARSIDFLAMSEDIPHPESRVTVDGERITLQWHRTNWDAHLDLVGKLKRLLRRAGLPITMSRPFDKRTPSHQCGTVRMGHDSATAPLDVFCRAHDHENLYVVDASFLPTSGAVNPALTVAAQALRVGDHILKRELGGG